MAKIYPSQIVYEKCNPKVFAICLTCIVKHFSHTLKKGSILMAEQKDSHKPDELVHCLPP